MVPPADVSWGDFLEYQIVHKLDLVDHKLVALLKCKYREEASKIRCAGGLVGAGVGAEAEACDPSASSTRKASEMAVYGSINSDRRVLTDVAIGNISPWHEQRAMRAYYAGSRGAQMQ
jgi:hypothetical protein